MKDFLALIFFEEKIISFKIFYGKNRCCRFVCFFLSLEVESLSSRVKQPGVVVRALKAGVQTQGLTGQFSGCKGASIGQ